MKATVKLMKMSQSSFPMLLKHDSKLLVTTLLENPKGPVELGNPNTCAEAKLCLFLCMPALEIVYRKTKVLKQLVF